jgi:ABC-2 type transport system permease protein
VDSIGSQSEIPVNDYIDIAVLGMYNEELYLHKHRITKNHRQLTIFVPKKPALAGIDPYCILIDRKRENNMINVINF